MKKAKFSKKTKEKNVSELIDSEITKEKIEEIVKRLKANQIVPQYFGMRIRFGGLPFNSRYEGVTEDGKMLKYYDCEKYLSGKVALKDIHFVSFYEAAAHINNLAAKFESKLSEIIRRVKLIV